jgi:hypothetical protein
VPDEFFSIADDHDPDLLLSAALDYAAIGWPVFPLVPRGKLPLIAKRDGGNGLHDATVDLGVVFQWWGRWPTANIGLRTGIRFDVVDIDGQEGLESLNQYRADRPMTWGPESETGGGGWHLLHLPSGAGNRAGILPHVDYRGDGGYAVAPPSVHPSGCRYCWAVGAGPTEQMEPLPDWLRELVLPPSPPPRRPLPLNRPGRLTAYAQRALESELGRVALAPVGSRNDTLNRAAFALGQLVAGGVLDLDVVLSSLLEAALRAGLGETESERSIASGVRSGARSPRRIPA